MANSKGSSNVRNFTYMGKHSPLPPKSPFPSISPSYADYASRSAAGYKGVPRPRDGNTFHQRTSSESQLIEEQPSWLDELLNEPETPVRKGGHRRSSSDSFAYTDAANATNIDYLVQDEYNYKNVLSAPSWGSQEFHHHKDVQPTFFYQELNSSRNQKNRAWDPCFNSLTHPSGLLASSCISQEADSVPSTSNEKQDQVESATLEQKSSSGRKECSVAISSAAEADTKRAKQQFAQRSRVRKLQYIAELERNVQALQAEGSEVSAEFEFVNKQNLILSMENKALKQRLESLTQEQLIKCLEHEVLEREIGRLRALYQQQQQPQQSPPPPPSSSHKRSKSRDLDAQFARLSLKREEANAGRDAVNGALHI